jgi:hypothetical protein
MNTVFAVGREHTVKSGEIDPGLGHKGSQTRNKIHRTFLPLPTSSMRIF